MPRPAPSDTSTDLAFAVTTIARQLEPARIEHALARISKIVDELDEQSRRRQRIEPVLRHFLLLPTSAVPEFYQPVMSKLQEDVRRLLDGEAEANPVA